MELVTDSKLKRLRINSGITVTELSRESGLSLRTINRIEGGIKAKAETLKQAYISLNFLRRKKNLPDITLKIV